MREADNGHVSPKYFLSCPLLSHSNSFGFEMEIDTAGCRAYDRNYIVGGDTMSRYSSIANIDAMLEGKYTKEDIPQALNDLNAMKNSIGEYQYKSMKALLESKLK